MKSNLKSGLSLLMILFFSSISAQMKNTKTETAKVYGNCGMCKSTIEKAINKKDIVQAFWNTDTKILTLSYDAKKTSKKEILKKVAEAGYDNEMYIAPTSAYEKLHSCCQYDRPNPNSQQ